MYGGFSIHAYYKYLAMYSMRKKKKRTFISPEFRIHAHQQTQIQQGSSDIFKREVYHLEIDEKQTLRPWVPFCFVFFPQVFPKDAH